jgi:multidrug efflux system membrane fusion protein
MQERRRFRWGFIVLGILLILLILWLVFGHQAPKPKGPPPVAVTVAKVTTQDVPTSITELGAAQAWQGVLINPQVNGRLIYVAPEGLDVKAGDLLVAIDCSPYQAALTQAQGALKRDQALLTGAQVDLARFKILASQNSIARQTYEDQEALVNQDEGTVVVDQGAVQAARVNVNWCRIPSPVTGRVGVRLVDPGNIVTTGLTTGIISVNQVEPIAVTFVIDEGDFQRLVQVSNGFAKPLTVEALSQETGADLGSGEVSIADNHVNSNTGTVEMKARFPNATRQLWPGQFVNVKLTLQVLTSAITVPSIAVNQGPKGSYVYLVGPGKKAIAQPVTIVDTEGANTVVTGNLKAGQLVVTDGQMTLKSGLTVAYGSQPPAGAQAPAGKPAP